MFLEKPVLIAVDFKHKLQVMLIVKNDAIR